MDQASAEWDSILNLLYNRKNKVQSEIFSRVRERIIYKNSLESSTEHTEHSLQLAALRFLFPSYLLLNSPFEIPGFYAGVDMLHEAISSNPKPKIVIFGDRDVDGVSSTIILRQFLVNTCKYPAEKCQILHPLREEKYGINMEVAERIIHERPDILISLDCGSANKIEFSHIQKAIPGSKVIIIDHHFIPDNSEEYPATSAFINPKTLPAGNPLRDCCTGALSWFFVWGIAYSFTNEYKKERLIDQQIECDGVISPEIGIKDKDTKVEELDIEPLWQHAINRSAELKKIDQFLTHYPAAINKAQRYHILRLFSMQKLYKLTAPFFPLAAMGTVGDLMPLLDDNRILLKLGLNYIQRQSPSCSPGFDLLIKKFQIRPTDFSEEDFAFYLCPAVNAAGRIQDSSYALSALTESDPLSAAESVHRLFELNNVRKEETKKSMALVMNSKPLNSVDQPLLVYYHKDVHRGISGLIASKLAEEQKKAICVLVEDGDCLRGSLRAFQNENVFGLFEHTGDLFIQYGGHRQAAGFSLAHNGLETFIAKITALDFAFLRKEESPQEKMFNEFSPALEVNEHELSAEYFHAFQSFAPYGKANPRPLLNITTDQKITGKKIGQEKNHLKIESTLFSNANSEAVWFFFQEEAAEQLNSGRKQIIMEPQYNFFRGRRTNQYRIKKLTLV